MMACTDHFHRLVDLQWKAANMRLDAFCLMLCQWSCSGLKSWLLLPYVTWQGGRILQGHESLSHSSLVPSNIWKWQPKSDLVG